MGVAQVPAAMQAELGLPDRESVGETLSRCPHFRSRQIVTTLWGCGRSSWASASDGNRGAAVLESLLRSRLRLPLSHPVSAPLPQPQARAKSGPAQQSGIARALLSQISSARTDNQELTLQAPRRRLVLLQTYCSWSAATCQEQSTIW